MAQHIFEMDRSSFTLSLRYLLAALAALFAIGMTLPVSMAAAQPTDRVDFRREVMPILSDRCFSCHGPDAGSRAADLRLDDRDWAVEKSGVVVPGDPEASELIRRVRSDDESEMMPPPDSHKKTLNEAEREIFVRWIREGAEYQTHWSFVPPARAELPTVEHAEWCRQPLDRFVFARLTAEGLQPSPEADRRTLIRRLSLDLTGLPPSAEEVEAFVNDPNEDSYERLVDRLLASSHFGERMGLVWLDAARYADTNGYSIDGGRHAWLWRDWVIHAFNQNMPYNQFLLEQLAGDLLPESSEAQLTATGFQRNNMVTHEGGTIPEENLVNYNADRVKTFGEAILGLTMSCAQCHDHKYDPISQREYYQLYAYFNTLGDRALDGDQGINPLPVLQTRTVLPADELPEIERQIESLKALLANPSRGELNRWEATELDALQMRGREFKIQSTELLKISTPNTGEGFDIAEGRIASITRPASFLAYDLSMRMPEMTEPITGLRVKFYPSQDLPGGGLGYGYLGEPAPDSASPPPATFVLTAFSASADVVPGDQVNLSKMIGIRQVTASSWRDGYRPEQVLDPRNGSGWSPKISQSQEIDSKELDSECLTVTFDEPIQSCQFPYLTVQLNFGHGRRLVAGRFEVFVMSGIDDGSSLPPEIIAALQVPVDDRSAEQQAELHEYYSNFAEGSWPLRVALANLEERKRVLTESFPTLVMNVAERPRETFVLSRGDYSQPTERVEPSTPSVLPPMPDDAPPNRLGLAQWVTADDHPLTSRVAVNRIWQMLFGQGLVRTPADFGVQGEYPTHPELLDWLAIEFVESGWDTKSLVRKIVCSATYRQSSIASDFLLELDPSNRLLARGPRFRLPAEFVRDSALKVSGLLVSRIGGPSVNPYAPGDLWREVSHYGSTPATAQTFVQDHGEKLYRRSLYTYWKRTMPPPNMAAFDAPNREVCVVDRTSTNTPLQALVLLNDVQFVEAARVFAERIWRQSTDDTERLQWAWYECLSRLPSDEEIAILSRALHRERAYYAANEPAAMEYLASGEAPRDDRIEAVEHAAWAQIAAMILNLSETITRN